jgi:hypothetical protein
MTAAYRPKVLVDFDGVIHRYSKGWGDGTVYDPPVAGARAALRKLEVGRVALGVHRLVRLGGLRLVTASGVHRLVGCRLRLVRLVRSGGLVGLRLVASTAGALELLGELVELLHPAADVRQRGVGGLLGALELGGVVDVLGPLRVQGLLELVDLGLHLGALAGDGVGDTGDGGGQLSHGGSQLGDGGEGLALEVPAEDGVNQVGQEPHGGSVGPRDSPLH